MTIGRVFGVAAVLVLAVTGAQAGDGHLYGGFREVEAGGDLRVRQGGLFPSEAALQVFE